MAECHSDQLQDHVVRVDLTIHREPLTDEDVELCFGAMQRGVQELAKRPHGEDLFNLKA